MTAPAEEWLKPGERLDDLQRNGLRLIQNPERFRFGMDAVLLADFVRLRPGDRVADFGTGTGILPLLLSQNQPRASFSALEIQPEMADMARRSVSLNGLEDRIHVYQADFLRASALLGRESLEAVVTNPPYGKAGTTLLNAGESVTIARHETACTLEEILGACAGVLKNRGKLFMVFPASRMPELFQALRVSRLEPKRMRMVFSKISKPPYLVLTEAVKNANPSLLWEPPLVVYDEENREMPEMDRIYHRKREEA